MTSRPVISTSEGTHRDAFSPSEWGLLAFTGITWGASFLFVAEGIEAFAPTQVAFLRIVLAFVTLSFAKKTRTKVEREDWLPITILSITWMALPFLLFALAEEHISSSLAGMINGAVPIAAALIATLLLKRLPGRNQRLGLLLGFVGLILVGLPAFDKGASSVFGMGLMIAALCLYGLSFNISVPLTQRYGSLPVLWRAQGVASLLSAPGAIWGLRTSHFQLSSLLAVTALGVGGTALAYVAVATLGARVGSTRASVTVYIVPPVALILGVTLRNESLETLSVIGTVVILAGAWFTSRADLA